MKKLLVLSAGIALAASIPIVAWASHGKAGLWEIKIQMTGMPGMPDMSKLPPEARAHMHGMMMSGNTMTIQHCMTEADVKNDHPNMQHNPECKVSNVRIVGQTFSADMTCSGHMNGTGHVTMTYDSPEHYSGTETIHMTAAGHAMDNVTHIEGRWLSPKCGNVTH